MATRTSLLALLSGIPQMVDLTADELVVLSITLGGSGGTNLTKAALDSLVANSHASGSDNQSIVAGAALSGGGSGATVTLDVEVDDTTIEINSDALRLKDGAVSAAKLNSSAITGQTAETSADDADLLLIYDNSATALKKMSRADFLTGVSISDAADISYDPASSGMSATNVQDAVDELDGRIDTVESLDPMEYKGSWDASSNTPTLANGTGNNGDLYQVTAAGTVDFGAGNITFAIGDKVVYNGTVWEKWDMTDAVSSVFGRPGAVTAQSGDYNASQITNTPAGNIAATDVQAAINELDSEKFNSADFSSSFDSDFSGKSTSDLAEGSNLYFTDERAQDAVGTILTDSATVDFTYNDGGPSISADVLSSPLVLKVMTAGESMAADTSFLVRMALSGETAGRVYKATNANAIADKKFYAFGIAKIGSAASAGDPVSVYMMGSMALGSSDTPFGGGDIGLPVYLTTAGGFSITPPSSSLTAVWRIGTVETTSSIMVGGQQLNGVN